MESKIRLNNYGYYERSIMPSTESISEMYENQFYQGEAESKTYYQEYSEQEMRSFVRNAAKKELMIRPHLKEHGTKKILDVGCGEGYILDYFYKKGWSVTGIDLSEYGILNHNPHLREFLEKGDCNQILEEMKENQELFDVVNADLFIECCADPVTTLKQLREVIKPDSGLAIIRVANCLSPLHKELLARGVLQENTWFDRTGNYAYFGKETLGHFLEKMGFACLEWYGDTFVDFNLINPVANYYDVDGVGKADYKAMLDIEDIMEDVSLEKMVELEKVMGDMGMGRHITCICRVKED